MSSISSTSNPPDIVFVKGVRLNIIVGSDCWGDQNLQQVIIDASVQKSITPAAESDDVVDALDYRLIYSTLLNLSSQAYPSKDQFVMETAAAIVNATGQPKGGLRIEFPKAVLMVEGGLVMHVSYEDGKVIIHELTLCNIRISCIIGIGASERLTKQPIILNLSFKYGHGLTEQSVLGGFDVFIKVCNMCSRL
jgi:dihydroneopterin aldolase